MEQKIRRFRRGPDRKRGRSLDRMPSNAVLTPRQRSYSESSRRAPKDFSTVDRNLRAHMEVPHTGPAHLFIKPDKFHAATSELHANHLTNLIQKESEIGRNSGVILCDGGPDWNFRFSTNLFNYGRLWWELGLDVLIFLCFAPGESRFNPIEHFWALVNLWLGKSMVPDSLELGGQEYRMGCRGGFYDSLICQRAVQTMVKYCSSDRVFVKQWNGFLSQAKAVPNDSEWKFFDDHLDNKAQLMKPTKENIDSDLMEYFRFLMNHCVRTKYMLQFRKDDCSECAKRPNRSQGLSSFLSQLGGYVPVPKLAVLPFVTKDAKRSYESFGDRCLQILRNRGEILRGDQGCPSQGSEVTSVLKYYCPEGCDFYFYNGMDMERHMKIVHRVFCSKSILSMKNKLFPPKEK